MSHLIPNCFSSYFISDDESLQGAVLTIPQKQVIQNCLASIAEEKLLLEFNTDKPNEFIQQEAYKRGQVDILTFILAESDAAEEALKTQDDLEEE